MHSVGENVPDPGLLTGDDGGVRCAWCGAADLLYRAYHDDEWGTPTASDRYLFEKLCLEGFQAGLSWITILRKRAHFRTVFANFEPAAVAAFGPEDVERLVKDPGIVRHRGKIESTINNARRALELTAEAGSLAAFLWQFEPDPASRPARITRETLAGVTTSAESVALSKALRKRGWSFIGPTTMYAFLQAVGIVNDHLEGCAARPRTLAARAAFVVPRP